MSTRTFIFCDSCNPLGLKTKNDGFTNNRRSGDNCSWHEGNEKEAYMLGWLKTANNGHLCPKCHKNMSEKDSLVNKNNSSRRFVCLSRVRPN